jgi:NAD(P)-dependent dehydrogenase (short-subunit alcohol dehydrogenase family)
MDLRLGGKRALVSGSTAGIGFAAAARLAEEGASVVVNGRSAERVEEAVRRAGEGAGGRGLGCGGGARDGGGRRGSAAAIPETEVLVT